MDNPFTCANGHRFTANAKVRARCPSCGAMARRDYSTTTEGGEHPKEPHQPLTEPKILRQGRTVVVKKQRSPAQLANDKRLSEMRRKATTSVKTATHKSALKPRVANGIVKTQRITRPTIPTVNRKPKRTAVAGQLKSVSGKRKSFLDDVMDSFRIF